MSVAPLALDDPAARDPAVVGVKAAGLAAAADAGLPVLPGWVLPVEASANAIAAGARALAREGPPSAYLAAMETVVPAGLDQAPKPRRPSGPEPGDESRPIDELWVVRSSTDRDGDGRWAGTFSSYLGIEAGDLPTAVRGCWASAFSGDALGRCGEAGVDVDTLRVGVLVQPFLRLDSGGTARVRADGAIDVAVAPGGSVGVVGGRRGGRDVTVGADGRIVGEPADGSMAATASAAARLARRAADTVDASAIEWGAVGDDLYLLQISPARRHEASSSDQPPPRAAAPRVPVPADAERLARLVTAFAGPLADELVIPWALGAGEVALPEEIGEVPSGVHDPASSIAEARTLAAEATAEVWGLPLPEARERAADVARLLLGGRVTDGIRAIADVGAPNPAVAPRVVGLVGAVGEFLARGGLLPSPLLIWRLTGAEVDRAIAGTPPSLRNGPGRWEPFVAEVVRARGRVSAAVPASPGIGAGRLHPLRELRSIGRPGPREVLVAPLPLPHLAPLLWHCAALVTSGGTSGAHLFEVARSLGVPAVIGPVVDALGEPGSLVAVDGDAGRVSVLPDPAATGSGRTTDDRSGSSARARGGGGTRWRSSR